MVYLVGAGPGDPELLTLKARRLLGAADAVLYDALANPDLLALAPARAERVFVGKRARGHSVTQREIGAWMVARARRGRTVVRLKGGDPAVFARADEEIAALRAAGVAYSLVPGVTAASAAAAALGRPLTARGKARGVRLLAGPDLERDAPAPAPETLAVYMGAGRAASIAAALRARGWPAATPAAVVARAGWEDQATWTGTLARLAAGAGAVPAPAVILVGAAIRPPRAAPREGKRAEPAPPGLILLAHGSPLPAWQRDTRRLARALAAPGQFAAAAFLPPVAPGLAPAVARAASRGVRRLAVVPYFLAPGVHVERDIPRLVAAARKRFPECDIRLGECLAGHPALRTAVLSRFDEVWRPRARRPKQC